MTRLPESVRTHSACYFLHMTLTLVVVCIPPDHRRRSFPLEQPPIRDLIDMTDEIGASPPPKQQQQRSRAAASVQAGWQSDPRPAGSPTRTVMYKEVRRVAIPAVLSVSVWCAYVCVCEYVCVCVCHCMFVGLFRIPGESCIPQSILERM